MDWKTVFGQHIESEYFEFLIFEIVEMALKMLIKKMFFKFEFSSTIIKLYFFKFNKLTCNDTRSNGQNLGKKKDITHFDKSKLTV